MRDGNSAEVAQLTIVLVHPSRLYTEGLASLLKDTSYNRIDQLTCFDSACYPLQKQDGKVLFVVGGRTSTEIASIVRSIRSKLEFAYILVINAPTKPDDVLTALEAGADGYLRDAISSQTFIRVIELIVEDETILPPEFIRSLREGRDAARDSFCGEHDPEAPCESDETKNEGARIKLSAREDSILRGLVDGAPNKVIAQKLHITEATVKVHVKAILRKIRVKNRTQAAIWASKHLGLAEALEHDREDALTSRHLEHGSVQAAAGRA